MKTTTAVAVSRFLSIVDKTARMKTNTAAAVSRFLSIVDKTARMKTTTAAAVSRFLSLVTATRGYTVRSSWATPRARATSRACAWRATPSATPGPPSSWTARGDWSTARGPLDTSPATATPCRSCSTSTTSSTS